MVHHLEGILKASKIKFEREPGMGIAFNLKHVHLRVRDPLNPNMQPQLEVKGDVKLGVAYSTENSSRILLSPAKEPNFLLIYDIDSRKIPAVPGDSREHCEGKWEKDLETSAIYANVQGYQRPMHLIISPM